MVWVVFSVIISIPWLNDLSQLVSKPLAILIIAGIGYIPGYINAFIVVSLLLDRQPPFKTLNPKEPVTIVIACMNEEKVRTAGLACGASVRLPVNGSKKR